MRNSRPSKQRLWLGTGRYPCCGRRRYTDADAHCDRDANVKPYRYSDSDRHSNGHRHCDSDGDCHANGQRHCHRHGNGQRYCNSIGHRHAATDANAQIGAIPKTAPHASAETIEFTVRSLVETRSRRRDCLAARVKFVSTRSGLARAKGDSWPEHQNSVDCFQRFR